MKDETSTSINPQIIGSLMELKKTFVEFEIKKTKLFSEYLSELGLTKEADEVIEKGIPVNIFCNHLSFSQWNMLFNQFSTVVCIPSMENNMFIFSWVRNNNHLAVLDSIKSQKNASCPPPNTFIPPQSSI